VGFRQQICSDLLVGGDSVTLDDEAGGWNGGFRQHRAEADVDGVGEDVRHALWEDDAVGQSHRVARRTLIHPYLARQLSDGEIWTAHGGVNLCGLVV
jgi:hypothetical protein